MKGDEHTRDRISWSGLVLAIWIAACAWTTPAVAEDVFHRPMTFLVYDPCGGGNSDDCQPTVLAVGRITEDTPEVFRRFMDTTRADRVVFHSPGGSLGAGLRLGEVIRKLELTTVLEPSYTAYVYRRGGDLPWVEKPLVEHAVCASACAYAFMGGHQRKVYEGSRLGFHQFRSQGASAKESDVQKVTLALVKYMDRMGVDRRVLDFALATEAADMTYLPLSVIKAARIDNSELPLHKWEIVATDSGEPLVRLVQPLEYSRQLGAIAFRSSGVVKLRIYVVFEDSHWADRKAEFPVGEETRTSLFIDGREFHLPLSGRWKAVRVGGRPGVQQDFILTEPVMAALAKAGAVELRADFPRALRDLDPSTELSPDGLNTGLALLRRGAARSSAR